MVEMGTNEKLILAIEGVISLLLVGLSVYLGVCYYKLEKPSSSSSSSSSDNQEYVMKNAGYLVGMIFTVVASFIMMFLCHTQYKRAYPSSISEISSI